MDTKWLTGSADRNESDDLFATTGRNLWPARNAAEGAALCHSFANLAMRLSYLHSESILFL